MYTDDDYVKITNIRITEIFGYALPKEPPNFVFTIL